MFINKEKRLIGEGYSTIIREIEQYIEHLQPSQSTAGLFAKIPMIWINLL